MRRNKYERDRITKEGGRKVKCGYNSCKWCSRFADDCEIIKENKDLQKRLDTLQGFLDRDVEYDELKNNLKKAKRLLEIFVEEVGMLPGCYRTMVVDDAVLETKQFLNWRIYDTRRN